MRTFALSIFLFLFLLGNSAHSQQSVPEIFDRGGISTTEASFIFTTPDVKRLQLRSEPVGIVSEDYLISQGQNAETLVPPVQFEHYQFAYWEESGQPFLSASGLPLQFLTIEMQNDRTLTAVYLNAGADQDSDGLPDWWEWRNFGNLEKDLQSDPDNDGLTIGEERQWNLSYTLPDLFARGGISTAETTESAVYLPFAEQPEDLTLRAGSLGFLQAQANIDGASYQWYRADGDFSEQAPIPGANDQSLELIIEEGPAWYWMVVTTDDATQSSRKVYVYGIGEETPDGLAIRVSDSTETYDRIELSVLDSSLDAEKSYAAFVSDDMVNWIRINTDVAITGPEAKAIFEVAPIEDKLFFKVEQYEYVELSEAEVAVQAERFGDVLANYGESIKATLFANSTYTEGDEEVVDLMVALIKDIFGTLGESEKAQVLNALYNGGALDELEAWTDASAPPIETLSTNTGARSRSGINTSVINIADVRWDGVKAARGWHVHSDAIKNAALIESAGLVLAGPSSVLTVLGLQTLSTLGDFTFNQTPSCPTAFYVLADQDTNDLAPDKLPYPKLEFYADFESKSSLQVELTSWVVDSFVSKLVNLYYKSRTKTADLQFIDNYLDEISNDAQAWVVNQSYSLLSSAIKSYYEKFTAKETWEEVQIDPDYFTWPAPITWNPIYENSKGPGSPVIYDSEKYELEPRWSGSGRIVFSIDDKLCKVKLEAEVPFLVENLAPIVGTPNALYLSDSNNSLSSDLTIEDDYLEDLQVTASATHGTADWTLDGGRVTVTYRPKGLDLNQLQLSVNSDEIVYDDLQATFEGGMSDQIELIIDDGGNPPQTVLIPVDLTPLLDSIEFTLGIPEPGMTSVFGKNGNAQTDVAQGLRKQSIGVQTADGYGGQGGVVFYSASLGSLYQESKILLFADSTGLLVNAGPDLALTDANGDGTEAVNITGEATAPEGATIESYSWSWNGGSSMGQTLNQSFPLGANFAQLTVRDSLGNEKYDSVRISVNSESGILSAYAGTDATKADEDINGTESFILDASGSSGEIVSWEWNWPAGSASGQTALVDFPIGQRIVTLTITDSEGHRDTDEVLIQVDLGCYPETRPDLNPITLPVRDMYPGAEQIGMGANTFWIGNRTGRWEYIQGVDCDPGIVTLTYDDQGNDPAIYYEKISLISGYGGTYLFQKFDSGELVHTQTGTYFSGDPP